MVAAFLRDLASPRRANKYVYVGPYLKGSAWIRRGRLTQEKKGNPNNMVGDTGVHGAVHTAHLCGLDSVSHGSDLVGTSVPIESRPLIFHFQGRVFS